MTHDHEILKKEKQQRRATLRYWLFWALLLAALAFGINRYFEYRISELDKRIELLK